MPHLDYNEITARHYAAYRPPLHERILSLAIAPDSCFDTGLDIGSGTGCSAIALSRYCNRVFGIEPSDEMRERAAPLDGVTYLPGAAEKIPLQDKTADVVTLAGSLWYADKPALVGELHRVCRKPATIIVYDFEILLGPVLAALGVDLEPPAGGYDHAANLSESDDLLELQVINDRVLLHFSPLQLTHMLLSSPVRYRALAGKLGGDGLEQQVKRLLGEHVGFTSVDTDLYCSIYTL